MPEAPQRQSVRKDVRKNAEIRTKENLLVGTVLDMSAHGAFFRPEAGVIDGQFMQIAEPVAWLTPGAWVDVSVQLNGSGAHWLRSAAMVRWLGENSRHDCPGLGLEFDAPVANLP